MSRGIVSRSHAILIASHKNLCPNQFTNHVQGRRVHAQHCHMRHSALPLIAFVQSTSCIKIANNLKALVMPISCRMMSRSFTVARLDSKQVDTPTDVIT